MVEMNLGQLVYYTKELRFYLIDNRSHGRFLIRRMKV